MQNTEENSEMIWKTRKKSKLKSEKEENTEEI